MAALVPYLSLATQQLPAYPPVGWNWDPWVLLGLGGLTLVYLLGLRNLRPADQPRPSHWRVACFFLAMLAIFVALVSPIHDLSDYYLFSVHMVQHLLLMMLMPILLLLSIPSWMLSPVLGRRSVRLPLTVLTFPPVAYFLYHGFFGASHLPELYELTLRYHDLHTAQHIVFMVAGVLVWWPVLSPSPEVPRLPPPVQVLYIFLQTLPMLLVGSIITDAPSPLYPLYAAAPRVWALDPLQDQQIGGLIMWVGGGMFYMLVLTVVFFRWALGEDAKEPQTGSSRFEVRDPRFERV